ncbi:MAG: ABC transporter ATP-binding protein [Micrococcaceae bacterium]
MRLADPAGLGRGPLTRWLPVLGQATHEPPDLRAFETRAGERPDRFVARVIFSLPRITIPAALLAIVWQVGESAVPVVMGLAIDQSLATGDTGQLVLWIGVLVALYVTLTTAARFTNRLTAYAIQVLQHRLQATLSTRVLHPDGGAGKAPDGGVVSTMTNDAARLANAILLAVLPIARVTAIGFIALSLLVMHSPLGVVVLLGAPVAVWLMGLLSERYSRDTREYQGLLASTIGRATDLVGGYRVIKGVRAEAEATSRYRQASQETLLGAKRNAGLLGRFLVGSGMLNGLFVAAVTGLAGWYAMNGELSIGGLITAVGLTQALLPQMQAIANVSIPNLAGARASSARILDLLSKARLAAPGHTDAKRPHGTLLPATDASAPDQGVLEVRGLNVGVPGATIRVEPGELIGIRADDRTAARITDALLNPHTPGNNNDGDIEVEVRLDGFTARELTLTEYRSRVTVVPHRVTLFTGTIRDNLTLAARAPELLDEAVSAAACEDFATDLDVPVGEGGNRLSGGQRQRIALARALATGAPVLVLHDPTTAVDSVTEQTIAERLRDIRAGHSTLLITSSPALLASCDRVVDRHEHELERTVS